MWQSVGKIRYKEIWLESGVIKAKEPYEPLYPFDKPDLPNEFSKVDDPKSALKFERKFAPLDYDSLLANPEERKGGDPVEWVLEHARFVKFALELIYALVYKDGRDALNLFSKFVVYKDHSHPALRGTGEFKYPRGSIITATIVPAPTSESDALWYAPSVIALLVNANTMHIHQELILDSKGRIIPVQFYYALIEMIWSMIGELATKTPQEGERVYFKRCEWCNSVFFAKDKRQRFCPFVAVSEQSEKQLDEEPRKQSLCGLKFRQHKLPPKNSG